jgi:ATP-dependent DNA ligase
LLPRGRRHGFARVGAATGFLVVGRPSPTARNWLREIKYDGYRLRLERNGDRVRLITRGGDDWTGRYP